MAPEVVLGDADTDHRVDLYALGCVAYWLLTGKLVFEGASAMQVMLQHVQAEPKRPSLRAEQPIPAALEALVMECLEKDPARRPASAEAVGESVRRGAADSGVDGGAGGGVVGDAPAAAAGRAACGGCSPVA